MWLLFSLVVFVFPFGALLTCAAIDNWKYRGDKPRPEDLIMREYCIKNSQRLAKLIK